MPCRDPGSSWGPSDLQSDALPTELSRLCAKTADAVDTLVQLGVILFWGPCG